MAAEQGGREHEDGVVRRVPDWLRRQAELQPQGQAVVAGRERWTFARLDEAAGALASHLARIGVGPGERVAVLAGNGLPYVQLVHALIRARAILVPLNVRLAPAELAWQIRDAGARWLIHDDHQAERAAAALRALRDEGAGNAGSLPRLLRLAGLLAGAGDPPTGRPSGAEASPPAARAAVAPAGPIASPPPGAADVAPAGGATASPTGVATVSLTGAETTGPAPPIDLAAPHCIIYTSGTTGRPKGAVLTYGNHFWSAVASALNLGLHRDDRWLACLPFFHVGGLSILFRSAIYGIPVVVHERFDPAAVNRAIDEERVTIVSVVSAMLQRMLEERGDRPYPTHLRCVLLGGGPAPRPLLEACAARGVPVVQTYGMTETASQFATLAPADALRKLGSAGKPLLFNELRIVRQDGRPAAAGEVGEILVRGPTVTPGYHNRPDAIARAWRDGWFHTGDLGYLDEEGYLYVVDRRDDLIISGGENVYPAEVEAVLLSHPAVEEAGVVGLDDPRWGQVPAAVVRLRPGREKRDGEEGEEGEKREEGERGERGAGGAPALAEELIRLCEERLARYKVPRRILFVAEPLPRTANGKLQRHALRQLFVQEQP